MFVLLQNSAQLLLRALHSVVHAWLLGEDTQGMAHYVVPTHIGKRTNAVFMVLSALVLVIRRLLQNAIRIATI